MRDRVDDASEESFALRVNIAALRAKCRSHEQDM